MSKQREMFESHFCYFDLRTEADLEGDVMYVDDLTQGAWLGWKAAIAAQPEVPLGWKLVPIVPTEKMVNEGSCAQSLPGPHYIDSKAARKCWEYMISMSPEPAK